MEGGISANIMSLSSIIGHLRVKVESSVVAVRDQDYWSKRTELRIPFPGVEPPRNRNL